MKDINVTIFHVSRNDNDSFEVSFYKNSKCFHVSCNVEEENIDETVFKYKSDELIQILVPFNEWQEDGCPLNKTRTIACH